MNERYGSLDQHGEGNIVSDLHGFKGGSD